MFPASQYLKEKVGGKIAIGENIKKVLKYWKVVFEEPSMLEDGSAFDHLFKDGEIFKIGDLKVEVIYTPGHTPACVAYYLEGHLFAGDTLFSPTIGTARTDFPGGSSTDLYNSIQKIFKLPDETKLVVGHDYPADVGNPTIVTTIREQKAFNVLLNEMTTLEEFTLKREERQKKLAVPTLLFPSIYVNLMAGKLPKFIKIPINKI